MSYSIAFSGVVLSVIYIPPQNIYHYFLVSKQQLSVRNDSINKYPKYLHGNLFASVEKKVIFAIIDFVGIKYTALKSEIFGRKKK